MTEITLDGGANSAEYQKRWDLKLYNDIQFGEAIISIHPIHQS